MPKPDCEKSSPYGYTRIRCLGPRQGEHYFNSLDRCENRICERCRKAMAALAKLASEAPMRFPKEFE